MDGGIEVLQSPWKLPELLADILLMLHTLRIAKTLYLETYP